MNARHSNRTGSGQAYDIAASLIVAPVVIVITVVIAIRRFSDTFTPDGIRSWLPVDATAATMTVAGVPVTGTADGLFVTVTDLNALSTVSIGASIATAALTWIAVAVCMMLLTRELIAARAFSTRATRSVNAASYITIGGAILTMTFDKFGQNGVAASLGIDDVAPTSGFASLVPYLMPWAFAFFIGVLGLAFTRGRQLQRDTEGLV